MNMNKPTLVIMAAGMGSRFGGMKQLEPVGPCGEFIIDYSIHDALKAGFGKVVLIIKKEYEKQFKDTIGNRISKAIPTEYAFQEQDNLPKGLNTLPGRVKPWGTAHAVYCVKDIVNEPFAVINADDFYGYSAFEKVCNFLKSSADGNNLGLCMAGYYIENTLTDNGSVTRGLCSCDENGFLTGIIEQPDIRRSSDKIVCAKGEAQVEIPNGTIASMNFFGFVPEALQEIEDYIRRVFRENETELDKAEVYLPSFVSSLIESGRASVKILPADEKWYGVTYAEDRDTVCKAIREMTEAGMYRKDLWG